MRNFAHSHLPTRNIAIVGLMLTVFIFFAALVPTGLMLAGSQQTYTNKTMPQQWEDMQRYNQERVDACSAAGGFLNYGDCSVEYPTLDQSWYVIPERNELQDIAVVSGILMVVFGTIFAFALPLFIWEEVQFKRERLRQAAYTDASFSLGTP